ncbi:hypothetical protein GCM10012275_45690 [Longimycelium tulufanense]|uniref:Uncharacterized protein n=1 Tax=Longimycelium tulufanense TaxID=907463 RepID=A0A8J3CJ65_9PSEU|nr:hypothetical protein GCM10012275_45690 [Longimycelium tulufanense]
MANPWAVMIRPAAVPLTPRSPRITSSTGITVAPAITPSVETNRRTASAPGYPTGDLVESGSTIIENLRWREWCPQPDPVPRLGAGRPRVEKIGVQRARN